MENKGNPYHAEDGKFTSKDGQGAGGSNNDEKKEAMRLFDLDEEEEEEEPLIIRNRNNPDFVHRIDKSRINDIDTDEWEIVSGGDDEEDDYEEVDEKEQAKKDFHSLKQECKEFAEMFPWEEKSKQNVMNTIDECYDANELFWGFLFNFLQNDIQQEMKDKFPGSIEKLNELCEKNKALYGKINAFEEEQEYFEGLTAVPETPKEKAEREEKEFYKEYDKEFNKSHPYEDWGDEDVGKQWRN